MTTKTQVLLPCPFCNSTNLSLEITKMWRWINCKDCGADGPPQDKQEDHCLTAEEVWNQRCK